MSIQHLSLGYSWTFGSWGVGDCAPVWTVRAEGRDAPAEPSLQVSTDGGIEPTWCGNRLFFRRESVWFRTTVDLKAKEPTWTRPEKAFETTFVDTRGHSYGISADCQRLLVIKRSKEPDPTRLGFITNFPALMKSAQK